LRRSYKEKTRSVKEKTDLFANQPLDKPSVLKVSIHFQTAKEALKENAN